MLGGLSLGSQEDQLASHVKKRRGIMPWLYKHSKEFLNETIRVWQPLSKEPLTYADAEEITENMLGLFKVLLKIDQETKAGE